MNNAKDIPSSPFKFLDSYALKDRAFFFGRDEEIQSLYERLFESNLVLLYGGSGTGKSSLIQCGLANLFSETEWLPLFVRREENLNDSLDKALLSAYPENRRPAGFDQWDLSQKIRQLYLARFIPIYIIFDQFEELFIQGGENEADFFFNRLGKMLASDVQIKILLSMREEYIAELSNYEHIIPEIFDHRMRLEKMNRTNLEAVIYNSTQIFNIDIDAPDEIVETIVKNIRDSRGEIELASLQIYLDKLYRNDLNRKKTENNLSRPIRFDHALIKQTRQLEDVLTDFLDEQIHKIEQELAYQGIKDKGIPIAILFSMVTEDATKRIRTADQIRNDLKRRYNIADEQIEYCISRFVDLRLVKILGVET
jgi:hypothetical protein